MGKLTKFLNRKNPPGFIVRSHQRNQSRIITNGGAEQIRIDRSIGLNRKNADLVPSFLPAPQAFQHRSMFRSLTQNMLPLRPKLKSRLNRRSITLRRTTGKNHPSRGGPDQSPNRLTRPGQRSRNFSCGRIRTGRVRKKRPKKRKHRIPHLRQNRCRCIIIEIDHADFSVSDLVLKSSSIPPA